MRLMLLRREVEVMGALGFESAGTSNRRPVCRRYESVGFGTCEVDVMSTGGGVQLGIRWALGGAADGQQEVLGAWPMASSRALDYQVMFDDLRSAGLERARFVLSREPVALRSCRELAAMGASVLPSVHYLLLPEGDLSPRDLKCLAEIGGLIQSADGMVDAEALARDLADASVHGALAIRMQQVLRAIQGLRPLYACTPRVRDIVLRCDARASELQGMLGRDVRRRGSFGSEAEALAFVELTLERGLERSGRSGRAPARRCGLKVAPRFATVRAGTPAGA
jgi:hypothetical protein